MPRSSSVGRLVAISATVVRTGLIKMHEYAKLFECTTCKKTFLIESDQQQWNIIPRPYKCLADAACNGTKFDIIQDTSDGTGRTVIGMSSPDRCRDYQDIKIQEQVSKLDMGTIPRSMAVVLENDLVDKVKAGDDVTIV